MDFQTTPVTSVPKNLYPCLATITVVPQGTEFRNIRRLSTASFGSNEGDGGPLTRVISGNRRRTSFGVAVDRGDGDDTARRRSFSASGGLSGGAVGGEETTGKWYWRVQAGATDNQLVLLPLTSPPNPVLTAPPQPLSHAMPAHSSAVEHRGHGDTPHDQHEGIGAKIRNFFRRSSTSHENHETSQEAAHVGTGDVNSATSQATATTDTAVDRIVDQTPQGEMLPSVSGNAVGATNLNANAETGWPGVINGQHLAGIVVDLHAIDKNRVTLGGGKKNEGSTVTVYVSGQSNTIDPVGRNNFEQPKSGIIKFEFDKDWIGAKGEAELLHYYITTALENLPERGLPDAPNFRLGADGN